MNFINRHDRIKRGKIMNKEEFQDLLSIKVIRFFVKDDQIVINNSGHVDLRLLTTLPENVKFENQGYVYLSSLESENITYRGQKIRIRTIDGYTMILGQKRKAGEATIYKAQYFGGGEVEKLEECFLANQGEKWVHGKTLREAVEDLRFKVMQADFDKDDVLDEIRRNQRVQVYDYRLLTGACKEGCRQFLHQNGYDEDVEFLPLADVIRLIPGHYGADTALDLLKPILKKGVAS